MKGIYLIKNPNNKIYIGQSIDIKKRFNQYRLLRCKGQPILYNSLKKYGYDNHIFEIIEIVDDENSLVERETYWKKYYNVLEIPSLCCKIDGRGGKMSKNSCKNLSAAMIKYWNSLTEDEYKKRISNYKQTEETINKIRLKLLGKKRSEEHILKLTKAQNKPETVLKRKQSLRKYWDEMPDDERERLRQLNIQTQNRPENKEKISLNNPSKRPEVKEKQIKSALNRPKLECPHCGKIMDSSNVKKYHFDRCKLQN
jgi:group I intron endonuclease